MRLLKRLLVIGLALFALIQLIPAERTNPAVTADFTGPSEIERLVKTACYDCHSNETRWPWYSYVAPVSLLITNQVAGARSDLNFSAWGNLSSEDRADRYKRIVKRIEKNRMPPPLYKRMHEEAQLTQDQRQLLIDWAKPSGDLE